MLSQSTRDALRPYVPKPVLCARQEIFKLKRELPLMRLKYIPHPNSSFSARSSLVQKILEADKHIVCPHTHEEVRRIVSAILGIPSSVGGCVVEAGCFRGGSTAKLSLATKLVNRRLFVFDSFAGLPENDEKHDRTIYGETIDFRRGAYTGRLDEVKENVRRFGALDICELVQGWFEDTMPDFHERIAVAFVDVDLASSTKTCIRFLYPLLIPGGSIFSHDGHIPLCIEALCDETFWREAVGYPSPPIPGLGHKKLLQIRKPDR